MGFDFKSANRNNWCRTSNMKLIKLDYDPEICYFGSYYLEKFQLRIQQNRHQLLHFWPKPFWKLQKLLPTLGF